MISLVKINKDTMIKSLWNDVKIIVISIQRFFQEKYSYHVSALAFTLLLALVPFLFVIVFFMALFPSFSEFIHLGEKYILANFVPDAAMTVQHYFQDFIVQASHLPTFSIV